MVSGLILISSCGGDPKPSPTIEEKQFKLMSIPTGWVISKVTYGVNTDRTDDFLGATLSITDEVQGTDGYDYSWTYVASTRPTLTPWADDGTWDFDSSSPQDLIIRGDDVVVDYSVTSSKLRLSFTYNGTGYEAGDPEGRVSAIVGDWIFEFVPN